MVSQRLTTDFPSPTYLANTNTLVDFPTPNIFQLHSRFVTVVGEWLCCAGSVEHRRVDLHSHKSCSLFAWSKFSVSYAN
jgi:hypothetical protein